MNIMAIVFCILIFAIPFCIMMILLCGWEVFLVAIVGAAIIVICLIANNKRKQDIENKENEEKIKKQEDDENKIKALIDYAEQHRVFLANKIKSLDKYYTEALSARLSAFATRPTQPTYTEGVVKGSIGDVLSTISNEQKKEEFDKRNQFSNSLYSDGEMPYRNFISLKFEIEAKIKTLPNNGQPYLSDFIRIYDEKWSKLDELDI